ncbi:hypothetical protein EfmJHP38_18410 [Enterococcus faecium]|nr:hypothetical protein EfmJHP38_18410 [Enterococcus faecium]
MNDFTTEIVQTLVTKGDLNELFRSHLEKAINTTKSTSTTSITNTSTGNVDSQHSQIRETVLTFDQSKPNMVN